MRTRVVRFLPVVASLALAAACARGTRTDATDAHVATLAAASAASDSTAPCWGLGGPPEFATTWERVDAGVMQFCVPPGGELSGRVWTPRACG